MEENISIKTEPISITDPAKKMAEAPQYKLHPTWSFFISSFLGTPLGAGIIAWSNYKAMGEPKKGSYAIVISALATIALFAIIVLLPENILDRIPNSIVPILYSFAMYGLGEHFQGRQIRNHESKFGPLYSKWRAAGIGLLTGVGVSLICVVIIFALGWMTLSSF